MSDEIVDELRSILTGLDELAELWGDEAKFRRMRDRLRSVVKAVQSSPDLAKQADSV